MSLDAGRLAQAFYLATGEFPGDARINNVAAALAVPEEIAPWLVLRCDGFKGSERVAEALALAVRRSVGRVKTIRASSASDLSARDSARSALASALKALIERDLASRPIHNAIEHARRAMAAADPTADDSHSGIVD